MAIKPTIYKLSIALSDFNRDYYDSLNLTVALHPSETLERMMARIVAYCLNVQENMSFTKGLANIEEPDVWVKTLDDLISLWIEVGEPSPDRIKKSSRLSPQVKIYSFNSKSNTWWKQSKHKTTEWKEYPPCFNLEKEFNKIFADTLVAEGVDQALLRLILVACYFKGSVSYMDRGKTHVSIKFEFPKNNFQMNYGNMSKN